jgi:hypothetical protein
LIGNVCYNVAVVASAEATVEAAMATAASLAILMKAYYDLLFNAK